MSLLSLGILSLLEKLNCSAATLLWVPCSLSKAIALCSMSHMPQSQPYQAGDSQEITSPQLLQTVVLCELCSNVCLQ